MIRLGWGRTGKMELQARPKGRLFWRSPSSLVGDGRRRVGRGREKTTKKANYVSLQLSFSVGRKGIGGGKPGKNLEG